MMGWHGATTNVPVKTEVLSVSATDNLPIRLCVCTESSEAQLIYHLHCFHYADLTEQEWVRAGAPCVTPACGRTDRQTDKQMGISR